MKILIQLFTLLLTFSAVRAQTLSNGETWRYQLTEGSALMADCQFCNPGVWEPLKGTFDLVGSSTPGSYIITNILFKSPTGWARSVYGKGTIVMQGSVPVITLDGLVFQSDAGVEVHMTNKLAEQKRIFPMISAQAAGRADFPFDPDIDYNLRILAAPVRELWFSTSQTFTNGQTNLISHGDLLSNTGLNYAGRLVKRNAQLTERLTILDGDVGLDAVAVGPRGEIFFSTTTNVESLVNGPIGHGDLVTSAGRVYQQSSQLLSAFGVNDEDAGLDGLQIVSDDEVYFSISKDLPRTAATTLHCGDILSNKGRIIRTDTNLFLRWLNPLTTSPGLDAFYLWPNGEIWFSTEMPFIGPDGLAVGAGDIISDQGYIAFKNALLLSDLDPGENAPDAGLDAMFIISDLAASKAETHFVEITSDESGLDLRWESSARVFQVERAFDLGEPFNSITDLMTDRTLHDVPVWRNQFYRIRQW